MANISVEGQTANVPNVSIEQFRYTLLFFFKVTYLSSVSAYKDQALAAASVAVNLPLLNLYFIVICQIHSPS